MTQKPTSPPNDSSQLPEIDPADMDAVTGGCASCGCGQPPQQQGASKLAALAPIMAQAAGR